MKDEIKSVPILAHEIGHAYIHQCSKSKNDILNSETLPVFLELYMIFKNYGKEVLNQYRVYKKNQALKLMIGDPTWFRKIDKIKMVYGISQANMLFDSYEKNPEYVCIILNEVISDTISLVDGLKKLDCELNDVSSFNTRKKVLRHVK